MSHRLTRFRLLLVSTCAVLLGVGCSYHPPGLRADLQDFAPASIQEAFAVQPTNPFPASVAVVRLQGTNYSNYYLQQSGGSRSAGRYTVVLAKEVNEDTHLAKFQNLPQLRGFVSLNRMLLPPVIESDQDLREAAARLRADLLLLYTFDTVFFDRDPSVPLSVITLGLSPTRTISATSTASALLLDTRTGFIYGAYEATERAETFSSSWGSREAADQMRQKTESTAFAKLADSIYEDWPHLLARHATPATPPPPPALAPNAI